MISSTRSFRTVCARGNSAVSEGARCTDPCRARARGAGVVGRNAEGRVLSRSVVSRGSLLGHHGVQPRRSFITAWSVSRGRRRACHFGAEHYDGGVVAVALFVRGGGCDQRVRQGLRVVGVRRARCSPPRELLRRRADEEGFCRHRGRCGRRVRGHAASRSSATITSQLVIVMSSGWSEPWPRRGSPSSACRRGLLITWEVNIHRLHDLRAHQHAAGARRDGQAQRGPSGGLQVEPDDHGLGRSRGGLTNQGPPGLRTRPAAFVTAGHRRPAR